MVFHFFDALASSDGVFRVLDLSISPKHEPLEGAIVGEHLYNQFVSHVVKDSTEELRHCGYVWMEYSENGNC